jgi:mono/diheme cytochrome c family protein
VPATPPAPTQPAAPTALTAAQRAPLGQAIHKRSCGACHDGPPGGNLENSFKRFSNAGQMFDYSRTNMPQNNPGSLPQADYLNVIVWVLLGSNKVTPDAVLDAGNLASVSLP